MTDSMTPSAPVESQQKHDCRDNETHLDCEGKADDNMSDNTITSAVNLTGLEEAIKLNERELLKARHDLLTMQYDLDTAVADLAALQGRIADCYDRGYAAGRASLVEIDNLAAIFTECDLGNEVSHCRCRDRMLNLCRRIRTAFEMKVAEDGKP